MKYLRLLFLIFIVILITPNLFSTNVIAGTEDAKMTNVTLTAIPYRQGIGGEVIIDASVPFFGGCCYPLFAYNVKATIIIPNDVELVKGQLIQEVDEVKAEEGGAATIVHFKWIIKSYLPESYIIMVNITTKNCGRSNARISVEVVEGCSMSVPELYPDIPSTNRNTMIALDVSSGLENIEVETVELFFVKTNKNMPSNSYDIFAENDSLSWSTGSIKGRSIAMNRVEYTPHTWKGSIPSQKEESTIFYWVVAKDNTGKNTTSIVYSFEAIELDRVYFIVDILNWLPIIGTIIGIIIIVFLFNKFNTPDKRKKILLIGSISTKEIDGTVLDPSGLVKLNRWRNIIAILLLICSIILILWAIYSGYFEQFTRLNGGI
ncbi:MAG: hypothetical protein ACW96X_12605 [Promethearchaeota archaeon]|jgi:hypothetical protein